MFESQGMELATKRIRIFVSYDREHDQDLHDRLVEQASKGTAGFEISARSRARPPTDLWDEDLRRDIQEADEVIVICGEHSDCSGRMGAELRITREEQRPYLLLWGRREFMCTRPTTAQPRDSMYSWTKEILNQRILTLRRAAQSNERAARLQRTKAIPKIERTARAQASGAS